MNDTIILYRPYADVEASVEALSPRDMHMVGRLNVSLIIKNILGALSEYQHSCDLIERNECVKFYWNNGKPYLCDLVWYYNVAEELHMDSGGIGYDYLEDCWDILNDHDCIENEAPWNDDHGNIHKLLLLKRDRWYRRKFIELSKFTLKDPNPFTSKGKPRKVKTHNIKSICHEKENI